MMYRSMRFCPGIIVFLLISVISLLAAGQSHSAEKNASKIVKRVRKTIDGIKTFSCTFESVQVWKELDRTQHLSGTIYMKMKKNFMLRLERPGHITVIDGKTIWTYLPKHRQVQISDYDRDGHDFPSPHNIFKRFADEREAVLSGEEEVMGSICDIISLVSDNPEDVKVTVWIDRELDFLVKAVEETSSGDKITHVLSDVRLNEKIDDDVFVFVPPEGVTKVDMRE